MSRTCARALVLVNWKGVFYERYELNRHVTALEGANGAGKTTVMIAAYVVLLPDMSRLRFTNLGETGATGGDKGIWGRLGDSGRPSYAAMDFLLPGSGRLIAGVLLEKKGEPSVEPTPFVVTGLASTVEMQDLMLIRQGTTDAVPELAELSENAARLGGHLKHFNSARDYFACLFDYGVAPLRLSTDEERNKYNEMLRTSMTGGISRGLTSELRNFLLREETGLATTLQIMNTNLEACRRTRNEVQYSQRLEQEIGGVFEAGQLMFRAAFLATRERAEELERRVLEAEAVRESAHDRLGAARTSLEQASVDLETAKQQRSKTDTDLDLAKDLLGRLRKAMTIATEVEESRRQLAIAEETENMTAHAKDVADADRAERRSERSRALASDQLAYAGLFDLQKGLDELHRRADAHRQTTRRLAEAERELGVESLLPRCIKKPLAVHIT